MILDKLVKKTDFLKMLSCILLLQPKLLPALLLPLPMTLINLSLVPMLCSDKYNSKPMPLTLMPFGVELLETCSMLKLLLLLWPL
jgi:hypothetical protein